MDRKGQLTLFIIIGIVILLTIAIFYLSRPRQEIITQDMIDTTPIKEYVDSCIEQVATPGVYLLAQQGGFIYSVDESLKTENYEIAYHSPSIGSMEEELSTYIENSLFLCLNLSGLGYDIEPGRLSVDSTILSEKVIVELDYPLKIRQNDVEITLSGFSKDIPLRLGHLVDRRDDIAEITDRIDLDGLANVTILPYESDLIISIKDEDLEFNFAIEDTFERAAPTITLTDVTAKVGEQFTHQLDVTGEDLVYLVDTHIFEIEGGLISFTPSKADVGNHSIIIEVRDGYHGVSDILFMEIKDES